jgi:translocator protein
MQNAAANSSNSLRLSNIVAFALTIVINGLAGSTTLLGGKNTAMVSDTYFTLVTPAGYVFSIWGVIYILLGVFVVYQALDGNQGKEFQKKIGWLFVISSLANIAWIFLWQYEYLPLSVVLIFVLFASLVAIYQRLGIGKKSLVETRERIAVHLPFSVYLGWITVATIADVAAALVSVRWNGFGVGPETWASSAILVALLITTLVIITKRDIAYSLVIIWALVGIAESHAGNSTIVMLTLTSAIIIAIIIAGTILVSNFLSHGPVFRQRVEQAPNK